MSEPFSITVAVAEPEGVAVSTTEAPSIGLSEYPPRATVDIGLAEGGPPGPQGPPGPPGPPGPAGPMGGLQGIQGSLPSPAYLPDEGSFAGEAWIVGPLGELWIWK